MREKKMGMRAVLTRLLSIATVACALVATPTVASAETQVMPDGVKAEVLPLTQANNEPVQITEPSEQSLGIQLANDELAKLLEVPLAEPLFNLRGRYRDQFNKPLYVGQQYIIGSRYTFSM